MFLESDFDVIRSHLERACDQCLLTKKHCQGCNVDRLIGIMEGVESNRMKPNHIISEEELAVLTNPGSPQYMPVAEKWRGIINPGRKELTI